jgi:hypothetical protein
MKRPDVIALVASTACLGAIAIAVATARHAPPEPRGWQVRRMGASLDAGVAYDSGPNHIQWIDCTGCLSELQVLEQLLDVQVGYGTTVDGSYVNTPKGNMWPDGAALAPTDPNYFATTHEVLPRAHPVIPNRYMFEVIDRDYPTVATLVAANVPTLPAPLTSLDSTWSAQLLEDGAVQLLDGAVTSVTALEGDAGVVDSGGGVTLDSGVHGIEAGQGVVVVKTEGGG